MAFIPTSMKEVYASEGGTVIVAGYIVTDAAHGEPAAEELMSGLAIEPVTGADGCYKITLTDDNIKKIWGILGRLGVGVSTTSVANLTAAATTYEVDCCYIYHNESEGYADFYIRSKDVDNAGAVAHVAAATISFQITYKNL